MATRVRKTPAAAPIETPAETPVVVTTRRRATTSRTAATRRVASSSRSQRIPIGADLAAIDSPPVVEGDAPAVPVAPPVSEVAAPVEAPSVVVPVEPVPSAPAIPSATADVSVDLASVSQKVGELHRLLSEGQDRLSLEISKSQAQTVRNVSGLAHDVDRLMNQIQVLVTHVTQTESILSRIEATLVPLVRGVSATLLPVKGIEKPVNAESLERGLATALAPLLAELIEIRAQRSRDSSLAQVEQQILLTELRRLRSVALPAAERTTDPLSSVGKPSRRSSSR